MHPSEVRATADQVRALLREQCPQWAELPVTPLEDDVEGTDHVLFRVGDELVARMPKIASAVEQSDSDPRWLPVVAPHLPVAVPAPARVGEPGAGFPWPWRLVPWIPGKTAPARVRPEWDRPPVWIHGDLQPGNLIVRGGRLVGVVDFGAFGVGDPAPDLGPALWTFTGEARAVYRTALGYDDATWLRACGWAVGPSLTGIDYYRHSFGRMAEHGRRMVRAVIAELS